MKMWRTPGQYLLYGMVTYGLKNIKEYTLHQYLP